MQIKFSLFMYKIIDIIVLYILVGVFGLTTNAMATYGTSILGNIFKFILTDYLSAITHSHCVCIAASVCGKGQSDQIPQGGF